MSSSLDTSRTRNISHVPARKQDDLSQRRALPRYALITPARNEEALIEKTLESVVRQTHLPSKWIIVDDGSTDKTPEIVCRYLNQHPWIEILRLPAHRSHSFAAKARCFNAGLDQLADFDCDFIANVDADISFDEDFFVFLFEQFAQDPALGVAGVPMREGDYDALRDGRFNETDVFGACQLFRRECLQEIGGYPPIRGGIDWAAVRMARMRGWRTRSFPEKRFLHHRVMGATACSVWRATWNQGEKDYYLGNHPLWEVFRVMYQMTTRPVLLKGLVLLGGYSSACVRRLERSVPSDLMRFHRKEQLDRLAVTLGLDFLFRKPKQYARVKI